MNGGVGGVLPFDERIEKIDERVEGLRILEPVIAKTTIFADVAKAKTDRRMKMDGLE